MRRLVCKFEFPLTATLKKPSYRKLVAVFVSTVSCKNFFMQFPEQATKKSLAYSEAGLRFGGGAVYIPSEVRRALDLPRDWEQEHCRKGE
jgi:hypothetical protein